MQSIWSTSKARDVSTLVEDMLEDGDDNDDDDDVDDVSEVDSWE